MAPDSKRLQRLIDDFKVEELLSLVTLEEIADAWCAYQRRPHIDGLEDEDPHWWAVELLMDSDFLSDETRVRTVLDLILEQADDEDVFGVFAAGPVEDFAHRCDESRLQWIEERAADSARFREALQRIHLVGAARGLRPNRTRRGCTPSTAGRRRRGRRCAWEAAGHGSDHA